MASQQQSKNWVFTVNNYTEDDILLFNTIECKYIVYGKEVGENGTPHLQGYIIFNSNKRLSALKKIHATAHWERSRGTSIQASTYCKKDNDFIERGECPIPPAELEKQRWKRTRELAENNELKEIDDDIYIKHYRTLKCIAKDNMKKPNDLDDVCGHWYYGEAGTGKTTTARMENPGAYIKSRDKWWDGYQNEEVVILDDLDKYNVSLGGYLKDWADKWTFKAETKGGYIWIRPKKFIITSQYFYESIFEDKETRDAIERRYKIRNFIKHSFYKK